MVNLYEILKNFPHLSRQLICKDLLLTKYDCPQKQRKESFYLERNLIIYVINGKRTFHKNGKSWVLSEGVCAFINQGTHISEKEPEDDWCVMAFFMPDSFLRQIMEENRTSLPSVAFTEDGRDHVIPLNVNELSRSFFTSMLTYFTQNTPPPENLLELKFKELILSLLSNEKNGNFLAYLHYLNQNNYPSIQEVVQNNYLFNLSVAEYAHLAYRSVPTFKREFKKIFNDSPARWIMKQRLKLATGLLKNTTLSVGEITLECGFENQTHFSRRFKESTGVSPLNYRMGLQSNQGKNHSISQSNEVK